MAIPPPQSSGNANNTCATCLRKFTINFRRKYEDLKGVSSYTGEYGFDWLRDEYYNPILELKDNTKTKIFDIEMISGVADLKESYKKGVKLVSPFGVEYFPSTLSIFSEKFIKEKKFIKIKSEVTLDLEIHQVSGDEAPLDLTDDTELEFKSSSRKLKFSLLGISDFKNKQRIRLIDLIGGGQKVKKIDLINNIERKFYKYENAITVKVMGSGIDVDSVIEVHSIRKGKKELVGILNVAKNKQVKVAKYAIINVLGDGSPIATITDLEVILKERSLNQALVDVVIEKNEIFDLRQHINYPEVSSFIQDFYYTRSTYSAGSAGSYVESSRTTEFIERLMDIYEKVNNLPYKINSDTNEITYLFLTNVDMGSETIHPNGDIETGGIEGSATLAHELGKTSEQWGNLLDMFQAGMNNVTTFLHELGHTFGLFHVFENQDLNRFIMGHTDNMMDYEYHDDGFEGVNAPNITSEFSTMQFSLYRWQWAIINADRSTRNAK